VWLRTDLSNSIGTGATLCAWIMVSSLLEGQFFDETFCQMYTRNQYPTCFLDHDLLQTPNCYVFRPRNDGATFGWKYIGGGYEKGEATFNGKPLLPGARSTFLFRTFGRN